MYFYESRKLKIHLKAAIKNAGSDLAVYFLLCAVTFGMLLTISQYVNFETNIGFLRFKQEYLDIKIWKVAFYVHVFSCVLTLCAGFTQFSNYILKYHKNLHRFFGRLYAYNILFINFPAGMIMAVYANGHLPTKIAFVILDTLWFLFTYKAIVAIRSKDIKKHKRFMIRSYALTCSAITLRLWKIVLINTSGIDPVTIYMIDAWLGFVPNLIFAEWLIKRNNL